jgi:D-serine deaminase-like pyridoxal phosphate-dependent protein
MTSASPPPSASRLAAFPAAPFELESRELERLLSPALLIEMDAVRHNIAAILARCGGDPSRWRPHLKTTKIEAVWRELVRAGLTCFKCATTREAALMLKVLRAADVRGDLLVAYPHVGPARAQLGALARAHPEASLSLLCEEAEDVTAIPSELGLFVDVNPGMDRTGLDPAGGERIAAIARRAGARFRGIHFYDGHIHDVDYATRRTKAHATYARLMALVADLRARGIAVGEIVTSGTPTLAPALEYAPFRAAGVPTHRISPGTVVFHDQRTADEAPELALRPAAAVLARVVSRPGPARVTCDAGSKSLAAEAGDPCAFVLGRPELVAGRPSEEHLPLEVTRGEPPARGDPLFLVPRHVCPTVNLAEQAVLIEGRRISGIVPVAARAHDLER